MLCSRNINIRHNESYQTGGTNGTTGMENTTSPLLWECQVADHLVIIIGRSIVINKRSASWQRPITRLHSDYTLLSRTIFSTTMSNTPWFKYRSCLRIIYDPPLFSVDINSEKPCWYLHICNDSPKIKCEFQV